MSGLIIAGLLAATLAAGVLAGLAVDAWLVLRDLRRDHTA